MPKYFDPDNATLKDKIIHASGQAGGMLVGNRHSKSGIKAINKSTGQPLEMEGGEVVITRNAVSDSTKRNFNGELLTNREILSKINESGGGVSFAEKGAELPTQLLCSGCEYEFGGDVHTDFEIMNLIYGYGGDVSVLENNMSKEVEMLCHDLECDGTTKILSKFLDDRGISHKTMIGEITQKEDGKIIDSFFPHQWIEADINGNEVIIDYKAKLWLGNDAPNGVILKDKLINFEYDGQEFFINPRVKDIMHQIQVMNIENE